MWVCVRVCVRAHVYVCGKFELVKIIKLFIDVQIKIVI